MVHQSSPGRKLPIGFRANPSPTKSPLIWWALDVSQKMLGSLQTYTGRNMVQSWRVTMTLGQRCNLSYSCGDFLLSPYYTSPVTIKDPQYPNCSVDQLHLSHMWPVRKVESQAVPQTYWLSICALIRCPSMHFQVQETWLWENSRPTPVQWAVRMERGFCIITKRGSLQRSKVLIQIIHI